MNYYEKEELNKNGVYLEYIRKSRVDIELERVKKMDTLKMHEQLIEQRLNELGISITKVYKEVVSGETIQDRPEMQKLLKEVEAGNIDGVVVVDIDRLSRGDTKDQGTVAQTFKYTNTKIITLNKIYDPTNEDDEDFFEFSLFMSRREYKIINKRMQRGKITNVMNGKYCGGNPPFGYKVVKLNNMRGNTLKPDEKTANIVKQIFKKRAAGMEKYKICDWLDSLGIKTKYGNNWTIDAITNLISNPVYIGKIRWFKRKTKKIIKDGIISKKICYNDGEIFEGLHPKIVDEKLFEKANSLNQTKPKTKNSHELKNPLAGLIKCKKCGKTLIMHSYNLNKNDAKKTIIERVGTIDRKYIQKVLYDSFKKSKLTKKDISNKTKTKYGTVCNWFANENQKFAIPSYNKWLKIKSILNITDKKCIMQLENIIERPLKKPPTKLICTTRKCNCSSVHLNVIENKLVEDIKIYLEKKESILKQYNSNQIIHNENQSQIDNIKKILDKLQKQLNKAYELVEQQIYTVLEFKERSDKIKKEMDKNKKVLSKLEQKKNTFDISLIPKYNELIKKYYKIETIKEKNNLLKSIVLDVEYSKDRKECNYDIKIHYKI